MSIVLFEDRGAVRHLVLNRPEKRNALNAELIVELREAFAAAAADDGVALRRRPRGRADVLGRDGLRRARRARGRPGGLPALRRPILEAWNLLEEMPKPTIAQIHGACLGGAMELALACDLRTMAADAIMGPARDADRADPRRRRLVAAAERSSGSGGRRSSS